MNHSFGLAALSVLELTPPGMVSCAADAGFACVGLRLIPATDEEVRHDIVGDTPLVRETRHRLADTGIAVLDVEIFRLKPDTDVRDYRAALETAARLGAREALVAGNDPDETRLIERFAQFCDLAREFGIAGNLEPMPWTDVKTFADGARVVEAAGRENAGVLIDALHFDRGGSRIADVASVPPGRLRYLQLCDAPAERPADVAGLLHQARAERLMPGDGGLELAGLLRAVPSDLPLSLEIPMQSLARTVPAIERARRMLARARTLVASVDADAGRHAP
jgi:sugar phosphate isomerase/epimerase